MSDSQVHIVQSLQLIGMLRRAVSDRIAQSCDHGMIVGISLPAHSLPY